MFIHKNSLDQLGQAIFLNRNQLILNLIDLSLEKEPIFLYHNDCYIRALVAQRIECWSSEPVMGVRFPPGANDV